ncbi:hypothetical protein [Nocardioides ferulae]|uniref:hypothetical protein n=1 Tax=Nocardioides ferulae TaxID=2340821 RepID=UPI000EB59DDB|nr:hypothetical protein [Nocardioides ferulae]
MTVHSSRRVPTIGLLGLVTLFGSVGLAGVGTAAATPEAAPVAAPETAGERAGVKTVYFDMFYQQKVAPKRIFLTASSGPYLKRLDWSDWGSRRASATGRYISDCASCPPPAKRSATVRFSKRTFCADEKVRTYRRAVVTVSEPDEGGEKTTFRLPMGCPKG